MNSSVRTVLFEMMHDRGFVRLEYEDEHFLRFSDNQHNHTVICFVNEHKVSVKKIKQIKEMLEKEITYSCACLVILYKHLVTTFAKQFISSDVKNVFVQLFSEKELSFNITKHIYVPKHTLLTSSQKKTVISTFKTPANHFPMMLHSDPVCRYFGCTPGSMFKIERPSETCGMYTLYRVVV